MLMITWSHEHCFGVFPRHHRATRSLRRADSRSAESAAGSRLRDLMANMWLTEGADFRAEIMAGSLLFWWKERQEGLWALGRLIW